MPVQTVTLNQVLDLFKSFAESHPMIRDYGYGQTSDIGVTTQMDFPYLWVSHQSDSTIRIVNKTQTPEIRFYILMMDQVTDQPQSNDENGENSTNGQEVLSDTFQYLQDLVVTINTTWNAYGLQVAEDVRCFPAQDETTDRVNGWVGELTLRMSYSNGNCIIPQ
jgi:hypothetical protein